MNIFRIIGGIKKRVNSITDIIKKRKLWGDEYPSILFLKIKLIISPNHKNAQLYHSAVLRTLSNKLEKYTTLEETQETPVENFRIWVLWWQGEEAMPPIVKTTFNSIKKYSPHEVVLLTKDNYTQYVTFSETVNKRIQSGCITIQHLSDLIRMNLLARHGGFWMDSTILMTGQLEPAFYNSRFCTRKAVNPNNLNVSGGRWNGQLLSTNKKNMYLFVLLDHLFDAYWQEFPSLIEYFVIDYTIMLAYQHNPTAKQIIDAVEENNTSDFYYLEVKKQFSKEQWDKEVAAINIHKTTYKVPYRFNTKGTVYEYISNMSKS